METLMQLSTDIGLSILKIQKIWCKNPKKIPFCFGINQSQTQCSASEPGSTSTGLGVQMSKSTFAHQHLIIPDM